MKCSIVISAGMYRVGSLSDTDAKVQTHRWIQSEQDRKHGIPTVYPAPGQIYTPA